MHNIAIQFEKVGKLYQLGSIGTGTLTHDLNRWWSTKILRKDDPFMKIGETNDRSRKSRSNIVWALKDISFDVRKGDIVGIIGKNGAGKSTLLKLLSRVTAPTTGTIKANGRIASLLEIGTGFHPEMTGRENVYMNGAIMGMSRREISAKFDEIVDFAGVARYVDTPTKRYSSGMMVRLGFAVAAFLEPEILVVDEVLAVGDAEFRKKAIGKIHDVSKGEGRTVLFVSHNMAAVRNLCKSGIVLENGMITFAGTAEDSIRAYLSNSDSSEGKSKISDKIKYVKPGLKIYNITLNGSEYDRTVIESNQATMDIEINGHTADVLITDLMLVIKNKEEIPLATLAEGHYKGLILKIPEGEFTIKKQVRLPAYMARGEYRIDLYLRHPMTEWQMKAPLCAIIESQGTQSDMGQSLTLDIHGLSGLETIAH